MLGRAPFIAGMLVALAFAAGMARAAPADGLAPLPGDTRPVHYKLVVALDAAASRYSVTSTVRFEVLKPTRRVVLNSRGLRIDSARLVGGEPAGITYDEPRHQVSFVFAKPLPAGEHALQMAFSAPIGTLVEGLFQVAYPDLTDGAQKKMYFTHLCCIATGRQFMPLWDRPDMKAVFELELLVPRALEAVANMPVARREPADGGMDRVVFPPTPKMSSYLLFFGVGEFDRVSAQAGPTTLSVIMQRGKAEQGRFALQASVDSLQYYNDYFQAPYALPKLDNVTFPGAGNFGAMENWGAIFYFEPWVLLDPALSTTQDRQGIYQIVAHEVAHMWFGNLVTMRGWDDLWLNEGFATWIATKTSDRFNPEWHVWLRAAESREAAMRLDARASTHPIIRKVTTLEEAELAFDDITYQKGSQVIRMIEAHVGEEPFRAAIRAHVRKHAYDNAVTGDLWQELERSSPVPVTAIARDFTEQDGVPLIDVVSTECDSKANKTRVMLKQGRFGLDAPSRRARTWHVPVTAMVAGSGTVAKQVVRGSRPTALTVEGCGPLKINVGESAYFRTRYDAATFATLTGGFERLGSSDQLGLLNDTYSLGEAGYTGFEHYWQLASRLTPASDPLLVLHLVRAVDALDHMYSGLPAQAAFRAYGRARLAPLLEAVGWLPREGEPANTGILRAALIESLVGLGHDATLAEARRRFRASASDSSVISVGTRRAIINALGAGADIATFDDFAARAARSTDTTEKRTYYLALAQASDPAIARKVMELALTDQVPEPLAPRVLMGVAEVHPDLAFDFVTSRFDALLPRLDASARVWFVPTVAANGFEPGLAQRLARFANERIGSAGRETVERAQSQILFNAEVRTQRLPQVDAWLRTAGRES